MKRVDFETIVSKMNLYGRCKTPFFATVNFDSTEGYIWPLDNIPKGVELSFPSFISNSKSSGSTSSVNLSVTPLSFNLYKEGFEYVQEHLHRGDSYLTNLTFPTPITLSVPLKELFTIVEAKYKIYVPKEFLLFSPESFVTVKGNRISSYPMKGTISADTPNAEEVILADCKEMAEHTTIVDLIRNDLSMVAKNVTVPHFRYVDRVSTGRGDLLQVSSEVSGELPNNWQDGIGNIFETLLPAGSISGAPKDKTVEIIRESELDNRGFYTGVSVLFDGDNLDSCVNIRYIEESGDSLLYRSGGGVTAMSNLKSEFIELKEKVYVPISRDNSL